MVKGRDTEAVRVGAPAGGASAALAPSADGAILDIPTQHCGKIKHGLSGRSRRLFSRAILGTKIPGRYYFLTVTSSPGEPLERKHWDNLRKWLKKIRPLTTHLHVITKEGFGVIHIIFRLGFEEKEIDVRELRDWWFSYHKAKQMKIVRVRHEKADLARYISDQRHKKGLAGEVAWQDDIVSWGYSKGWLPKGFGKEFGRYWWKSRDADMGVREKFCYPWLLRCYESPAEIKYPPHIESGRGLE